MFNMKKLVVVFLVLFVFKGCVGIIQKDDECMKIEAKDSVICSVLIKMGISTRDANMLFKFANLELIRNEVYSKENALTFLQDVEAILNSSTYQGLAKYLIRTTSELTTEYNVQIILLSEYFNEFVDIPIPISEFDIYLLKEHINQQKNLVLMIQ